MAGLSCTGKGVRFYALTLRPYITPLHYALTLLKPNRDLDHGTQRYSDHFDLLREMQNPAVQIPQRRARPAREVRFRSHRRRPYPRRHALPKMRTGICAVQNVRRSSRAQNHPGKSLHKGDGMNESKERVLRWQFIEARRVWGCRTGLIPDRMDFADKYWHGEKKIDGSPNGRTRLFVAHRILLSFLVMLKNALSNRANASRFVMVGRRRKTSYSLRRIFLRICMPPR